jgi:hypothetical protein
MNKDKSLVFCCWGECPLEVEEKEKAKS